MYIKTAEAARRLGVSRNTVYNLIHGSNPPFLVMRVGAQLMIDLKSFNLWLTGSGESSTDDVLIEQRRTSFDPENIPVQMRGKGYQAFASYNAITKELTIAAGAQINTSVEAGETLRNIEGETLIFDLWSGLLTAFPDGLLLKAIICSSASQAAKLISGAKTSGMRRNNKNLSHCWMVVDVRASSATVESLGAYLERLGLK